jgi:hypothetical protein
LLNIGRGSLVAGLVDEDEAAGAAIALVRVEHQRLGRAQTHAADVVELQLLGRRVALERFHVKQVINPVHDRRCATRRLLY